jgi:hypothetical protein
MLLFDELLTQLNTIPLDRDQNIFLSVEFMAVLSKISFKILRKDLPAVAALNRPLKAPNHLRSTRLYLLLFVEQ